MLVKALCEWSLTDGIYPPVRLDAPEYIEDALTEAGVLAAFPPLEERCKNEWIYRRTWRYLTQFTLPGTEKRVFIRLNRLQGRWRLLVNGALAAEGSDSWCEAEITALLSVPNYVEVVFPPDESFSLFPKAGFAGSLMWQETGKGIIKDFRLAPSQTGEPGFMCAADLSVPGQVRLSFGLQNSRGEWKQTLEIPLDAGHTPLLSDIFAGKLARGEINRLSARLDLGGQLSDQREAEIYIPNAAVPMRRAICEGEAELELARELGAQAAYSRSITADAAFVRQAAGYGLYASGAEDELSAELPLGMCNPDETERICPDARVLEEDWTWHLAESDRACYDAAGGSGEELAEAIALSRYNQAIALENMALKARLNGEPFTIKELINPEMSLSSAALVDHDGLKRPAFFALKDAWQAEYAFCSLPESLPEDGIFTVRTFYVCDDPADRPHAVSVCVYDLYGREIFSTTFAATVQGCVGSFALEMPEGGVVLIRTSLSLQGSTLSASDLIAFMPGRGIEDLGEARLYYDGKALINDSDTLAAGVCADGAGFFGCLLPGESVPVCDLDINSVEGLNIYF
ncbi:MAG: hypothetical protein K5663_02885 [Clostridiales bacterium]|nr:hypothetical protein [Clostridiales bacterium]